MLWYLKKEYEKELEGLDLYEIIAKLDIFATEGKAVKPFISGKTTLHRDFLKQLENNENLVRVQLDLG